MACAPSPSEDISWEDFRDQHTKTFDGEEMFVVEWDTAVSHDELRAYYLSLRSGRDGDEGTFRSIVNQVGGVDDVWTPQQAHDLTYCVTDEFGADKDRAVQEMREATSAWEAVADIDFTYRSEHDADCDNGNGDVLFSVQPWNASGACAFFPSGGGCIERTLVIDFADLDSNPFYGPNVDSRGVFRHELGHILGLRHEHTRPEAGQCFENDQWRPLTPYDVSSVMHYPWCNGDPLTDLSITPLDAQGVQALYGHPNLSVEILAEGSESTISWSHRSRSSYSIHRSTSPSFMAMGPDSQMLEDSLINGFIDDFSLDFYDPLHPEDPYELGAFYQVVEHLPGGELVFSPVMGRIGFGIMPSGFSVDLPFDRYSKVPICLEPTPTWSLFEQLLHTTPEEIYGWVPSSQSYWGTTSYGEVSNLGLGEALAMRAGVRPGPVLPLDRFQLTGRVPEQGEMSVPLHEGDNSVVWPVTSDATTAQAIAAAVPGEIAVGFWDLFMQRIHWYPDVPADPPPGVLNVASPAGFVVEPCSHVHVHIDSQDGTAAGTELGASWPPGA